MNSKEKINIYSFDVNDLLTDSININDKFIKEAGTIASLFKKVDFQSLYNEIGELLIRMKAKLEEIINFSNENKNYLTHDLAVYLDFLIKYLSSLFNSISILNRNVGHLYEKSQRTGKFSLWQQFRESRDLNKSIEEYQKIGIKLNQYYKAMYGGN